MPGGSRHIHRVPLMSPGVYVVLRDDRTLTRQDLNQLRKHHHFDVQSLSATREHRESTLQVG